MSDYIKTFDEWVGEIRSIIKRAKDDGVIMYIPTMDPDGIYLYRDADGTQEIEI